MGKGEDARFMFISLTICSTTIPFPTLIRRSEDIDLLFSDVSVVREDIVTHYTPWQPLRLPLVPCNITGI